jgi:hypothetical protein
VKSWQMANRPCTVRRRTAEGRRVALRPSTANCTCQHRIALRQRVAAELLVLSVMMKP